VLAQVGASAKSRFNYQDGPTPVVRPDGVVVASSATQFWAGNHLAPISQRSDGGYMFARVFTGATSPTANGSASGTCNGWTDWTTGSTTVGYPTTGPRWFNGYPASCVDEYNHLYCLEDRL
jgi:hypothetical protein